MSTLAVVLAVDVRRHPEERTSRSVEPSRAADVAGAVDVLAGVDGSSESLAALHGALALLGDRVGRLTIATVLPYEAGREDERAATERLLKARDRSGRAEVGLDLLHGRPGAALMEAASEGGYELIVVGKRGTGLANRLIGSPATDLASRSKVAVLLPGD